MHLTEKNMCETAPICNLSPRIKERETFVSGCFLSGFVFIYSPLYNLSECVIFPCEREEIETFKEFKMLFFFSVNCFQVCKKKKNPSCVQVSSFFVVLLVVV